MIILLDATDETRTNNSILFYIWRVILPLLIVMEGVVILLVAMLAFSLATEQVVYSFNLGNHDLFSDICIYFCLEFFIFLIEFCFLFILARKRRGGQYTGTIQAICFVLLGISLVPLFWIIVSIAVYFLSQPWLSLLLLGSILAMPSILVFYRGCRENDIQAFESAGGQAIAVISLGAALGTSLYI